MRACHGAGAIDQRRACHDVPRDAGRYAHCDERFSCERQDAVGARLADSRYSERRLEVRKLECLALALGGLTLAACGDDKPDVREGFANLRAMHLVQGGPDVDVVLNMSADPSADDVSFTDSSDYQEIAIGTYTLEVKADDQVLLTTSITLENKQSYTFVVHDRPESIQGTLFQDGFEIASGEIKTRLFNMAPGSGPMALYFIPDDNSAPQKLTTDVAYGTASEPTAIADGNHNFGLDLNLDGVVDVTYDLPPLSDGTLANVYAVYDDNADLDLILQLNDGFTWDLDGQGGVGGAQARARAIHLISGAPALSVFTAGATVTTGLEFMQESSYVGVPNGSYDVFVSETALTPAFTVMGAQFDVGTPYTIVLFGGTGEPVGRTIKDDTSGIPTDQARVRMIHTAVNVGEIDFWNFNAGGEPILLFEDLDFGEESSSVDMPAGSFRLAVDVNNDNVFDAFFDTPSLPAGQLVNFYAVMDNGSPRLVTQMDSGIMSSGMIAP
jgi:hypothetical protein